MTYRAWLLVSCKNWTAIKLIFTSEFPDIPTRSFPNLTILYVLSIVSKLIDRLTNWVFEHNLVSPPSHVFTIQLRHRGTFLTCILKHGNRCAAVKYSSSFFLVSPSRAFDVFSLLPLLYNLPVHTRVIYSPHRHTHSPFWICSRVMNIVRVIAYILVG